MDQARKRREAEHVDKIRKALRDKKLVIIVGSGLSLSATHPSPPEITWTGLMKDGLDYLRQGMFIKADDQDLPHHRRALEQSNVGIRRLLRVCYYLKDELDYHEQFPTWLTSVFGSLHNKVTHPEVFQPIHEFHRRGAKLMTTNYDELLEHFCHLERVRRSIPDDVRKYEQGTLNGVFHIHGSFQDPQEVVFDPVSYYHVKTSDDVQSLLKTYLGHKIILFVGCGSGLEDPNLNSLLAWTSNREENISNHHYLLVRDGDPTRYKPLNRLEYGPKYEDLVPYLNRLLDDTMINVGVSSASVSEVHLKQHSDNDSSVDPITGGVARSTKADPGMVKRENCEALSKSRDLPEEARNVQERFNAVLRSSSSSEVLELRGLEGQVAFKIFAEINKMLEENGGELQQYQEALTFFCLLQLFKIYFPNSDVVLDPVLVPEHLAELRRRYVRCFYISSLCLRLFFKELLQLVGFHFILFLQGMRESCLQIPRLVVGPHIVFEDMFGEEMFLLYRKHRHWRSFNAFLQDRFKEGHAQNYVAMKQFLLYDYQDEKIGEKQWHKLVPDSKVNMSIIIKLPNQNACGRCFKVEYGTNSGARIKCSCGLTYSHLKSSEPGLEPETAQTTGTDHPVHLEPGSPSIRAKWNSSQPNAEIRKMNMRRKNVATTLGFNPELAHFTRVDFKVESNPQTLCSVIEDLDNFVSCISQILRDQADREPIFPEQFPKTQASILSCRKKIQILVRHHLFRDLENNEFLHLHKVDEADWNIRRQRNQLRHKAATMHLEPQSIGSCYERLSELLQSCENSLKDLNTSLEQISLQLRGFTVPEDLRNRPLFKDTRIQNDMAATPKARPTIDNAESTDITTLSLDATNTKPIFDPEKSALFEIMPSIDLHDDTTSATPEPSPLNYNNTTTEVSTAILSPGLERTGLWEIVSTPNSEDNISPYAQTAFITPSSETLNTTPALDIPTITAPPDGPNPPKHHQRAKSDIILPIITVQTSSDPITGRVTLQVTSTHKRERSLSPSSIVARASRALRRASSYGSLHHVDTDLAPN